MYKQKEVIRDGKTIIIPVLVERQAVFIGPDDDILDIHGPKSYVNPEECPDDWREQAIRHFDNLLK